MMAARASSGAGGKGGGGWTPALGRRAADLALKLRAPARVICGSLRAAVIAFAALFAVFLLAEATIISNLDRGYTLIVLIDVAVAASNVGLIFGTITGKLNYLYGWLSLSLVDLGAALACLIWLPIDLAPYKTYFFIFPLIHLWSQLMLVALVHGLAHELRGGRSPDYGGDGGGGGEGVEGVDGWLQLNLAHAVPPLPVAGTHKPRSPAVLEPSMCTTAQPPATTPHSQC